MYMDELNIYENNLSKLLDNYEKAQKKYINDLRLAQGGAAPATASAIAGGAAPLTPQTSQGGAAPATASAIAAMASLNQEITFLLEEISSKINKINQTSANADVIAKKKAVINDLNSKMRDDGDKINALLNDTVNLDGKNESIRLQTKTSLYYLTFYTIIIIIIGILFVRIMANSETSLNETILLVLAIALVVYQFKDRIKDWFDSIRTYLGDGSYSWLARMIN